MRSGGSQLKKIPVSQLRVGMHLHALEGAWLDHPFWRTKFVIDDPATIRKVQQSAVRECWIDASLGLDVVAPEAPAAAAATAATAARAQRPVPTAAPAPAPPPPAATLQSELQQAADVCRRSREAVTSMFAEARLGKAIDAEHCLPLVDDITRSVFRNPGALVSLARLKTQDDYTYMHSVAVCALMVALARQLGHSEADCREAGMAGLLHDLGKAAVPLEILQKPDKLTDGEFAVIKTHPERGYEMLREPTILSIQQRKVVNRFFILPP